MLAGSEVLFILEHNSRLYEQAVGFGFGASSGFSST
jgi:hypothetical protein